MLTLTPPGCHMVLRQSITVVAGQLETSVLQKVYALPWSWLR